MKLSGKKKRKNFVDRIYERDDEGSQITIFTEDVDTMLSNGLNAIEVDR